MFFLIDHNKKIIFGWSAKCGCTHIKIIFKYLTENIIQYNQIKIHNGTYNKLPSNHKDYKIILIIRNPFERIISGYNDKYGLSGECLYKWKENIDGKLTFNNFTKTLIQKELSTSIDKHHFTKQLSEAWKDDIKPHKIYDIKNIDYKYIEKIYNKKIPDELKFFRGNHSNVNTKPCNYKKVFDLQHKDYEGTKPTIDKYYNKVIYNRIKLFYAKDLEYFKKYGFNYDIEF